MSLHPKEMHKKPAAYESCGQCFLRSISDQMFVAFVPVSVTHTDPKIVPSLAFIVESAQSKILSLWG